MQVSPVEQDTIDCEYLAYFEPKKILKNSKKENLNLGVLNNLCSQCFIIWENHLLYLFWAQNRLNTHNQLCLALLETPPRATSM